MPSFPNRLPAKSNPIVVILSTGGIPATGIPIRSPLETKYNSNLYATMFKRQCSSVPFVDHKSSRQWIVSGDFPREVCAYSAR
jgi:hypothetical protein